MDFLFYYYCDLIYVACVFTLFVFSLNFILFVNLFFNIFVSKDGDQPCRICGSPLDTFLEHGECCATAEATRGHYACVRAVVRGLSLADPAVTMEPRGLTDTMSRPADILTYAAVPGRGAALDVCIASPNSAAAAGDAAAAAFARKLRRYRREIPQLRTAGIVYRPMAWTADGRPHPAVTRTLRYAAEQAVHRSDRSPDARSLMSRWCHEIRITLQQRRAAMGRAVLPQMTASEAWMLTGTGPPCRAVQLVHRLWMESVTILLGCRHMTVWTRTSSACICAYVAARCLDRLGLNRLCVRLHYQHQLHISFLRCAGACCIFSGM